MPANNREYQRAWRWRNREAKNLAMREGIGMDEARRRIAEADAKGRLTYRDLVKYSPDEVRGG